MSEIAERNNISNNRVRQIINNVRKQYEKGDDELYSLILRSGNDLEYKLNTINMTYENLKRSNVKTIGDLLEIDLYIYQNTWFVGKAQLSIIENAINIEKGIVK